MDRAIIASLQPAEPLIEVADNLREDVFLLVTFAHVLWYRVVILGGFMLVAVTGMPDKAGTKERYDRHRHEIGAKQCDDYREGERGKQILAHACEQSHREEHDGSAAGCRQNGQLDLFATFLCRLDAV